MQNYLTSFLTKFLLLLSAFLSLHSVLALPLSLVLASKYHAVVEAPDLTSITQKRIDFIDASDKQTVQSKLQVSLLTLLQQDDNSDNLVMTLFLATINELDTVIGQYDAQSLARQSYQVQLTTHTTIQGRQNTLYTQKPCYQAKSQYQKKLS